MSFARLARRVAEELRATGRITSVDLLERFREHGRLRVSQSELTQALMALRTDGTADCEERYPGAGLEWFVVGTASAALGRAKNVTPGPVSRPRKRKASKAVNGKKKRPARRSDAEILRGHVLAEINEVDAFLSLRELEVNLARSGVKPGREKIYYALAVLSREEKITVTGDRFPTLYGAAGRSPPPKEHTGDASTTNGASKTTAQDDQIRFKVPGRGHVTLSVPPELDAEDWQFISNALSLYTARAARATQNQRSAT